MLGVFRAAATGMVAHQELIDAVANNLANTNTPGFKFSRPVFQDLIYERVPPVGDFVGPTQRPVGGPGSSPQLQDLTGAGVGVVGTPRSFEQGEILPDGVPLHAAIEGEGFFVVNTPDGGAAYTRAGNFQRDAAGRLTTGNGEIVLPETRIPADARQIHIDQNGLIFARLGDQESGEVEVQLGEIQLARFTNPHGLVAIGNNLFLASEASGPALIGYPGQEGYGALRGGAVEQSNVDLAEQLTTMLVGQRAYALSARALQTMDDMVGLANNLRR